MQKVTFKRDDLNLAGLLFQPKNFTESEKYSAVIVQGSGTSVKEQMGRLYSQKLAEQGFVCLAFDYAHYGESEGEPRQFENPAEKLADLKAAVTYLLSLSYIKDVYMVGICTSGGNAMYLAANDDRVKAVATVAGYFMEPELRKKQEGANFEKKMKESEAAIEHYQKTGENLVNIAYDEKDLPWAMRLLVKLLTGKGAFDYYTNPKRGNVPAWKNEMSVSSFKYVAEFDAVGEARKVKIPVLIIHSNNCSEPKQAKKVFELLQGEKQLAWDGGGSHFDYYDKPKQVNYAVEQITQFFRKHIKVV